MDKEWKFTFKSWQDYALFVWVLTTTALVSVVAMYRSIAVIYYILGLFTSVVLTYWVKRNKDGWKKT